MGVPIGILMVYLKIYIKFLLKNVAPNTESINLIIEGLLWLCYMKKR